MDLFYVEAVGLLAGCFTTCAFVPQVIRTYRSKSVGDISLRMYALMCCGIALWVTYGVLINSVSVMVANGVSFCLTLAILVMKLIYKSRMHEPKAPRQTGS